MTALEKDSNIKETESHKKVRSGALPDILLAQHFTTLMSTCKWQQLDFDLCWIKKKIIQAVSFEILEE